MTVKQLLGWCILAYDKHDDSYNEITEKYDLCKRQSLVETSPTKETAGYTWSDGEFELATNLMFSNSDIEILELENNCCEPEPIQQEYIHNFPFRREQNTDIIQNITNDDEQETIEQLLDRLNEMNGEEENLTTNRTVDPTLVFPMDFIYNNATIVRNEQPTTEA